MVFRGRERDPDAERLYAAIGTQVKKRRKEIMVSQQELAEMVGTTQSAIARLERSLRPPRIDTLLRIADALDCELVVELRPRTTS